jgi:hypothetical protein
MANGQYDDFALASWSILIELLKHLQSTNVLTRSEVLDILNKAARPMQGAGSMTGAAVIIKNFADSV